MKVTWASNAPWTPTGYGAQTAQVTRRLRDAGHDVAIAANYGLQGRTEGWEGILVLPQGKAAYSDDLIPAHHVKHAGSPTSGWLVTLYDVWPLSRAAFADFRVASWVPVDHYPVPPEVAAWCSEHYSIAMSLFGQKALADLGIESRYVPHGIEPVFAPTPSDFRRTVPRTIDGKPNPVPDDAFLVMVNAANHGSMPVRKAWYEMLEGFARFARKHSDARIYLHTDLLGVKSAPDLRLMIRYLGLEAIVHVAPQYDYVCATLPPSLLAAAYSASDVLLSTSMGEGFGVPVVEAQACGTPVIVTDWTAQPELVGAGWTVPPVQLWYDALQAPGQLAIPSIRAIESRLEDAYNARGDQALRDRAVAFGRTFDADAVFDRYWRPVLDEMAEIERRNLPGTAPMTAHERDAGAAGLTGNEPIPLNRAARRKANRR